MYNDTTVIIPTFNEEGNIKELLAKLIKEYPKISIIVSDDGSNDKTQEIVKSFFKKGVNLLDRKDRATHGLSESVIDACLNAKTDNLIVMDADFQHPIEKIREIIPLLRTYELIICARKSFPKKWPISRKM